MTDIPLNLPQEIVLEMDKVAAVIATARRLMADGRTVDLTPLEGKIESLCGRVRETPKAHRDGVIRAMESLIKALDELEGAIRARVGGGRGESEETTRRRVLNAYVQPKSGGGIKG